MNFMSVMKGISALKEAGIEIDVDGLLDFVSSMKAKGIDVQAILKAATSWSEVVDTPLGHVDHAALQSVASIFGHQLDDAQSEALLALVRSEDPGTTLGEFISGGKLFELITNRSRNENGVPVLAEKLHRCRFCDELQIVH